MFCETNSAKHIQAYVTNNTTGFTIRQIRQNTLSLREKRAYD